MNIPGFTAELSLSERSGRGYQSAASLPTEGAAVVAQLCWCSEPDMIERNGQTYWCCHQWFCDSRPPRGVKLYPKLPPGVRISSRC